METPRIIAIIAGVGISLAGFYMLADGITGNVIASNGDFFAEPKIPIGLVVITLGVAGVIVMERLSSKKSEQTTLSAPPMDFNTIDSSSLHREASTQMAPTTIEKAPVTAVAISASEMEKASVFAPQIEKPSAADFKRAKAATKASARRAAKKSPARKAAVRRAPARKAAKKSKK